MTRKNFNYWMMYHEIQRLNRSGWSIRKISEYLVLNFRTVSNYLSMSEDDFFRHLEKQEKRLKKLDRYEEFIKTKLELYPETPSAQMHDWLKEYHKDFREVSPKTVFNFVLHIRQKYNIPQHYEPRNFFPVEELEYGRQAQADFGETSLRTTDGRRKKIYFFCMVLSRSRHKFVFYSDVPFTTQMAILAHEKAFEYFHGIVQEVVYDQDKLFIHDENYGDLLLTKEFKAYVAQRGFCTHFCRKADPQSKGKIENVVRYIKQNFLYNRLFVDIDTLNRQGMEWLSRTANAMPHNRTLKIPFNEWQIEVNYLKQYVPMPLEFDPYIERCVRKDNTIAFRSSFYTLPEGTYQNKDSVVLLRQMDDKIYCFNKSKEPICVHTLSTEKGKVIRNTDHKRDKGPKIAQLLEEIAGMFGPSSPQAMIFLKKVHEVKPRYVRDQLVCIRKTINELGVENASKALVYCSEMNLFDATSLKSVAEKYAADKTKSDQIPEKIKLLNKAESLLKATIKPLTSNITDYEKLLSN